MPYTPASYKVMLTEPNTGDFALELPFVFTQPYVHQLSGIGGLAGTVPMDTPGLGDIPVTERYEITVLRDDGSGYLPDWNGPIATLVPNPVDRVYEITAQEFSWIFSKRTVEVEKDYTGWDRYAAVRDLINYVTTKTSTAGDGMSTGPGSNINAALPRFAISPSTGTSGYTLTDGYVPADPRYLVSELFERIFDADPDHPVDWKMDYQTGSSSTSVQRTLTLGNPLGVVRDTPSITNDDVYPATKEMDRFRAANRIHAVGAAGTVTLQNESDITIHDDVLLEAVFDKSDVSDTAAVRQFAKAARSASYPPITTHTFTFVPGWSASFPFGWCDLGDYVLVHLSDASFTSIGHRRVTKISVLPGTPGNLEQFIVDISIPIDRFS